MGKKTKESTEYMLVDKHPKWLDLKVDNDVFDEEFLKIILFYVFYSPCSKYCTQRRDLQYYHWSEKPWRSKQYLRKYLDEGVFEHKCMFQVVKRIADIPVALRKAKLTDEHFPDDLTAERVAIFDTESNEYMSVFYHIRCALAHGRVAIIKRNGKTYFVMENGSEKGNAFIVKARLILSKDSLIKWIDVITSGPPFPEQDYVDKILIMIEINKKTSIKSMASELNETEYAINKAISALKNANVIKFEGRGRNGYWVIDYYKRDRFLMNRKGQFNDDK